MQSVFELSDLVWVIGFQLTAYVGWTDKQTVLKWLRNGLPVELEPRMRAALDVALPIAEMESEYVAQSFLMDKQDGLEPYDFPATMLRDADVETSRAVLMELARKEFLDNQASDLEDLGRRLKEWLEHIKMPPRTYYRVHLWQDRLSLSLDYFGHEEERRQVEEQHRRWDKGKDWPLWEKLLTVVPEMANARTTIDIQAGHPFRYLRRTGSKPDLHILYAGKKEWLQKIKQGLYA